MQKRYCFAILALFLTTAWLPADKVDSGAILRVGLHTFPANLHPVYSTDETSQAVINKVYESLYGYDTFGNITKQLASSHRLNVDGREIILYLRRDVFFSNGKPLRAVDVAETFKLLKNPEYRYLYGGSLKPVYNMEPCGKYAVKVSLDRERGNWRSLLMFKILNADEIKGSDYLTFRKKQLSGTGPYIVKQAVPPTKIILGLKNIPGEHRVKDTPDGQMFERIEYEVISYPQLAPLKLAAGEIDICELPWESITAYKKASSWRETFYLMMYKKMGFTYLAFNLRDKRITKEIRVFFYNFLVRGGFVETFLENRGEGLSSPFPHIRPSREPGEETLRLEPFPEPVTIKVLLNGESRMRREFIIFLRQQMKRYNVHLEPIFLEYAVFLDTLRKGKFEAAVSGFLLNNTDDIRAIFSRDSYFNYSRFNCPELEGILDRASGEPDPVKRDRYYREAHDVWRQHLPIIPLCRIFYYMGISRKIPPPARPVTIMGAAGDFLYNIGSWRCSPK